MIKSNYKFLYSNPSNCKFDGTGNCVLPITRKMEIPKPRKLNSEFFCFFHLVVKRQKLGVLKQKRLTISCKSLIFKWALTDSNRRPSACKADALNQLS